MADLPMHDALRSRTRFLAMLGLVGIAQFVLCMLALHAVSLSSEPWHMSEFAHSPYAWLWVAGIYAFAVGGVAITIAFQPHLPASPVARAGAILLWLAALGAFFIAVFPTDPTPHPVTMSGTIHNTAAWPTFVLLGTAMMVFGPALRTHRYWRPFADASLVLGLLCSGCGVLYLLTDLNNLPEVAVVQRILVGLIASWFVLLALNLLALRPTRAEDPEVRDRVERAKAAVLRGLEPAHRVGLAEAPEAPAPAPAELRVSPDSPQALTNPQAR